MTTDGFIVVEYRAGSGYLQIGGSTVYNEVEPAQDEARTKQRDALASGRHKRVAVARIEVLA